MAKAYDRVKWGFLRKVILTFGFSLEWVEWIWSCVTSPSFSVLLNGEPSKLFGASRGLCQDDPLSPYLLIIMVEGLGRFIKHQVSHSLIHGWRWGNGFPTLSHLHFVDDTTLTGRARIQEAEAFRLTLDTYLAALGQKINDHKSSIYFFNTLESIQQRIANILRFQIESLPMTYLGIPIVLGTQPKIFWQNLLDKLRQKVNHGHISGSLLLAE
ncbi:uncharacterized mitochondrial protein AtMg01250-like [Cryptomeria japonica]|uniref:uncharacterized mitochondrial protein AtMg01250-like n=1 Tax=Cryptomeria japonica TaxID=3369 RepID=UPI0027DA7611|nr:uncharacterized mitochondrial protein AtMg01250-like [Cryptomeria japonica]